MASRATIQPTYVPPESGISVRMYNSRFGDCFLLAFSDRNGNPRYVLIDCGVHQGYSDKEAILKEIVSDIAQATGNHLHLVVITHEHADHINGFNFARNVFDQIEIDDLWLAWTEDPSDALAKRIKQKYAKDKNALKAAIGILRRNNMPLAAVLQGVLDFEPPDAFAATGKRKISEFDYLRKRSKKKLEKPSDYRRPGEILALAGVQGFKTYILGPPRDINLIGITERASEEYFAIGGIDEIDMFSAAVLAANTEVSIADEDGEIPTRMHPFDACFEIATQEAGKNPEFGEFFRTRYGFQKNAGQGPEWRRIENDWLAASEQLALKINSYTNNTTLALAIELGQGATRKVLLFAGDAQVGNWLSWYKLHEDNQEEKRISITDLFHNTVLYKVGHHGSHNATLGKQGLEMMQSDDLVAMIPVDEKYKGVGGEHPYARLLERLMEKTRGRVFRSDEIPKDKKSLEKPDKVSESEWKEFLGKIELDKENGLWIQFSVS